MYVTGLAQYDAETRWKVIALPLMPPPPGDDDHSAAPLTNDTDATEEKGEKEGPKGGQWGGRCW